MAGLRTMRAGRARHANLPRPGRVTAPPAATSFVIMSVSAARLASAVFLSAPVASAEATGADKKTADANLAALTDIITKEVAAGGAVTLPGLGKFACRARPARMVRNPATGEQMHKDADRVAKVTIAKALKDVINA